MSLKPRPLGEPFRLLGRRLVFADWNYIRPAGFGWFDDEGRCVSVVGDMGPFDATFKTTARPFGIRIKAQKAQRSGPILERKRPWEMNRVLIHTLLREGKRYRAWGSCGAKQVGNDMSAVENLFCYLESDDGYAWKRPSLGLVDYQGNKKNNLLPSVGGTVFVDPSARPAERYKWITLETISRRKYDAFREARPDAWDPKSVRRDIVNVIFAVLGGVSPDGLRWRQLAKPLAIEHSDTQIVAYYDGTLEKYVSYTRFWPGELDVACDPAQRGASWMAQRRSIGRAETSDFRRFPLAEPLLEPGPDMGPSDVFYANCKTTVPGAPEHHLLFPTVWDTSNDTTRVELFSSRDGKTWHRVPGSPVLETAPFGEWDGGSVFASPNLVELPDGSFVLPYSGYDVPHKYPRRQWHPQAGYAVWPHGRLVGVEAAERGAFSTFAIVPKGRKLYINARTKRAGGIRVGVQAFERQIPVPGRELDNCVPVVGDHPRMRVRWQNADDLGTKPLEPVCLSFEMDQAELFGLEFE